MSIIADIVSQHAESASMLWLHRRAVVDAPHCSLKDLAKLDGRLEAHLDGLRVAGEEGWLQARQEIAWEEPGEVFCAAALAAESGRPDRVQEVLEVVLTTPELADGFVSAVGWVPPVSALPLIRALAEHPSPIAHCLGLAAACAHRIAPMSELSGLIGSEDPILQTRALKATGELGRVDLIASIVGHLGADHSEVAYWSAWSAYLLTGQSVAGRRLQEIALTNPRRAEVAASLLGRRLPASQALNCREALWKEPGGKRPALALAASHGDPAWVPWLIEQMSCPEWARLAGQAFSLITGVGLAYQDLEGDRPEGFESGPTEDPEDEDVEMDPDEDLAWPNPGLIRDWWGKHGARFPAGTRHLCGKPLKSEWLREVLRDGFQPARASAALELALLSPGKALFNWRAPGGRQIQMLGVPGEVLR